MTQQPIRVALVDDHTLFRMGLAELLEQQGGVEVVGIAGNGEEARMVLSQSRPDIVIMDLHLPPVNGIDLLRQLREEGFEVPTLMLTVSDAEEDLAAALRAGARGYLLKDMEPEDVLEGIQRALRGETVVAPSMTRKLVDMLKHDQPTRPETLLNSLTQREREILVHLAQGESNKVIAKALDISHDTVKLHVRHILSKLNLNSRVEAAVFAVEHRVSMPRSTSSNH
ncbi:MAG: response regulator [Sulfuricellaceae bacterium]|jgi:two-component system nitrate/nitrite response regulator NarL